MSMGHEPDMSGGTAAASPSSWVHDLGAMWRQQEASKLERARLHSAIELARLLTQASELHLDACLYLLGQVDPQFVHLLDSPIGWHRLASIAGMGDVSFSVSVH